MEIGFNDDVPHRGMTFHIQTEDHGNGDERVSTQLFHSGRILDSKTVSYGHLLVGIDDEEERRAKVRKVMVAAHRNYYRRLLSGDYDVKAGLEPENIPDERKTVQLSAVDNFEPTQSRVPDSAVKVTEDDDGKVTFTFDDGNMMDLKALSRELGKINVMPEDTGVVDDHFQGLGFDDDSEDIMELDADDGDFEIEVASPVIIQQEPPPPLVPDFPPTGHLAFQGLLEPEATVDVVDMVSSFLQTLSKS